MYCSDKLQPETKQVFNIIIISTIYNLACMPAIFSYRQHAAEICLFICSILLGSSVSVQYRTIKLQ